MQVLSVQQLYKICTQYWDDKYNTESVSEEVIRESIFLMLKDIVIFSFILTRMHMEWH